MSLEKRRLLTDVTFLYRVNKLTLVFHASVLLLIMNFVMTVDPQGNSQVDWQTTSKMLHVG